MNQNKIAITTFFLLSALNIIAVLAQWQTVIYLTKPLLMTILAFWFFINTKDNTTKFTKYIFIGIIFSIAGDTFLLFVNQNPNFFLLGLGSFLITHIFYILAFNKFPNLNLTKGIVSDKKWVFILVIIYLISFLTYLWNDLPSAFKIAVTIYGCVISLMLISAVNLSWRVSPYLSKYIIIGAILFVFSDSVIALDKFKPTIIPSNIMGFIIMTTYIIGQYLIAKNCIEANKEIQKIPL
jgi:uncharacterized membrane protein YhhN